MSHKNGVLKDTIKEFEELRRDFGKQSKTARKEIQKRLERTAENLRADIGDLDHDARKQAERLLTDIEDLAANIETTAEERLQAVDKAVHKNPWRLILTAFVVGLIVGILIKKD